MKRVVKTLMFCCLLTTLALAHQPGRDKATLDLEGGTVTVEYGTPKLGERDLDAMIKPGTPWRMGMNEATTLTTSVDLMFGQIKVAAGTYTLAARSDADMKWTLILTGGAQPLEAPMQFERHAERIDVLKMTLERAGKGGTLRVAWGNYRLMSLFNAGG